jgi:hypothetical protein
VNRDVIAIALLALACASAPAPDSGVGWNATSDSGRLVGRLAPESGAVQVGEFQSWLLALRYAGGGPARGAELAISGGMPGHGHGLPSQPRIAEELPDGLYRIEGLKLNMHGAWVIEVYANTSAGPQVSRSEAKPSEGQRDRLRFDLTIDF